MTTSLRRIPYYLVIASSTLPYLWVAGILWLAVRARLHLGYWPRPNFPDPKQIPFEIHQGLLSLNFIALEWSILVVGVAYLLERFVLKSKRRNWPYKAYFLGWVLIFVFSIVPGIDFVTWFMD